MILHCSMCNKSKISSTTEAHWIIPLADFERGSVRPKPQLEGEKDEEKRNLQDWIWYIPINCDESKTHALSHLVI